MAGWAVVAVVAAGCGDASHDEPAPGPEPAAPWRTSSDPVETSGLIWAGGSIVHLSEGTTIDLGDPVKTYVVAGDGIYFFPAESEDEIASVGLEERELLFADADGSVTGTGLILVASSLTASPDGRYLAGLDMTIGDQDRYGTRLATARVFDLETGEEVLRTSEGMGDTGEDDLSVLYENVRLAVTLTDDTAYVEAARDVIAYDLATGEGEVLPEDEDPPTVPEGPEAADSPDGEWTISDSRDLRDSVTSTDGETVTPRPGTDRWILDFWVDDRTVVGVAVSGPGRGPKVDPRDTTTLMTCTVPSGECDVLAASTGQLVVYPRTLAPDAGVYLQSGGAS